MKDFDSWNSLKKTIDASETVPTFREKQIWWCSIGVNVGYELYGKDKSFTRPVLILRKFGHYTFFGIPLTSAKKDSPLYFSFPFKGKDGALRFDQVRLLDSRRLLRLMGAVTDDRFAQIRTAFKQLI